MLTKIKLHKTEKTFGTGWLPPAPDQRDYSVDNSNIKELLDRFKFKSEIKSKSVDLRQWCSPVRNQGEIGSCTAQSILAVVEYFQNKTHGNYIEGSPLFLYKITRNLLLREGDTGAMLRNAIGAIVKCGVPSEEYWPYTDKNPDYNKEPTSFVFAVAGNYKAVNYYCHDPVNVQRPKADVLQSVKDNLRREIPSVFGFWAFSSFEDSDTAGHIPFPHSDEKAEWGHAVATFGYDDDLVIKNTKNGKTTKGALLIKNSWGTSWGQNGYGWIPYEYVEAGYALDFWSLLNVNWVDRNQFGLEESDNFKSPVKIESANSFSDLLDHLKELTHLLSELLRQSGGLKRI